MNHAASLRTPLGLALLAGLGWVGQPALAQPPTAGSFVLSQSTVNSGGATAVSPSFVLDGSAAQRATVGAAGSGSYVLESGFWNSLSSLDVLRVAGAGSGEGSAAAPGIDCALAGGAGTGDCSEQVTDGTTVEIVAAPAPASRFDGWSGCDTTTIGTLPGDTCRVRLIESRTATAAFSLLGTVGARAWRDLDGDGVLDAGEPGIDGVEVTLADGAGFSETATTAGGGLFAFADVPPGGLTLAVDTATLPPGVFPSFDADGVGTPHVAALTLAEGEGLTGAGFGYHPLADLAITKLASADSLPPSGILVYTIAVENLGPASAAGVTVNDLLPAGLTPVATAGCAEDPAGVPTCTVGDLAPGAIAGFTIEVTADPTSQAGFSNTATVAAAESDPHGANNLSTVGTGATPVIEIPVAGPVGSALLALFLAAAGAWLVWRLR